jgi:hypothetical protein
LGIITRNFGLSLLAGCPFASTEPANPAVFMQRLTASIVQWPTGLHALMAFLQPEALVERLMAEIDRIVREQQIAELEREIDRLQRTEEAIVVATGAPHERGCPP